MGRKVSWDAEHWAPPEFLSPQIPLGLMDDPLHQGQPVFTVHDNLLIFGPSGSGKSVALLTIAMGIGLVYSPAEAYIYCVDIDGQSPLKFLEKGKMPHLPQEAALSPVTTPSVSIVSSKC